MSKKQHPLSKRGSRLQAHPLQGPHHRAHAGERRSTYTEDAYLLPPDSETVKGRAAIQTFWTNAAAAIGDLKLTTVDVKPLGSDAAREIGTFTLKTKGDKPQEVAGKYVVIWEKAGAQWKLATDIWNMDK